MIAFNDCRLNMNSFIKMNFKKPAKSREFNTNQKDFLKFNLVFQAFFICLIALEIGS